MDALQADTQWLLDRGLKINPEVFSDIVTRNFNDMGDEELARKMAVQYLLLN